MWFKPCTLSETDNCVMQLKTINHIIPIIRTLISIIKYQQLSVSNKLRACNASWMILLVLELTCFSRNKVGGLRPQVPDLDVVVQDGLGVVGHHWKKVAFENHLAVVEVEAANLKRIRTRELFALQMMRSCNCCMAAVFYTHFPDPYRFPWTWSYKKF